MPLSKKLGIFLEIPDIRPGSGGSPVPWSDEDIRWLRWAFVRDLAAAVAPLKKTSTTLFFPERFLPPGDNPAQAVSSRIVQTAGDTAERLCQACHILLEDEEGSAVVISAACPDLPVQFIKRAFLKLKRKDIVLGPATAGGWYLLGLNRNIPELLTGPVNFKDLLERVHSLRLDPALLFPWYRGDTVESLEFLNTMIRGRQIEKSRRFNNTEAVLSGLLKKLYPE